MLSQVNEDKRRELPDALLRAHLAKPSTGEPASDRKGHRDELTEEERRGADVRVREQDARPADGAEARRASSGDRATDSPRPRGAKAARRTSARAQPQATTKTGRPAAGPQSPEAAQAQLRAAILQEATISSRAASPGESTSQPASNVAATAAAAAQPTAESMKQAGTDGHARAPRAAANSAANTTNSTHSNHSRDHSHDHSRDPSQSRNTPSTTYASSSESDHSTRPSKDSGLGVSPGSPPPPGSSNGPQPLPSADALRLIANSSALSTSTMELPAGSLGSAAAPSSPVGAAAVSQLAAPQGSDATARAAAVEQLRAQVLQQTARIRGFNGHATLHFSADGLGDFEMKVQRTEQGWEVVLRPRERQTEELLQAERRRIASALQDIDEDISFDLDASGEDPPQRRPNRSIREANLAAHRVHAPRPPGPDVAPTPSPPRTARVLSPDGIVDIVV